MNGEEKRGKGIIVTPKPAEAVGSTAIGAILIEDPAALARYVLDELGIEGERRKDAEKLIGKGDQEADRTSVLLLLEQAKWQQEQIEQQEKQRKDDAKWQQEQIEQQEKQRKDDAKWRWIMLGMAVITPFVAAIVSMLLLR